MTIDERIKSAEQRFEEFTKQRDTITEELTKLQGEWRLLQDMKTEQSKPNKKATVIEAVPEGKKV